MEEQHNGVFALFTIFTQDTFAASTQGVHLAKYMMKKRGWSHLQYLKYLRKYIELMEIIYQSSKITNITERHQMN